MVTKSSNLRPVWIALYMGNSLNAVVFGLYARRRPWFRKDFTYNKYHFGVFMQMFGALGIAASAKLTSPLLPGLVFLTSIALVSFPAYIEGIREVRNEPDRIIDKNGYMRRVGIYCMLAGYGYLFYKRRSSIPFLPPKLKSML